MTAWILVALLAVVALGLAVLAVLLVGDPEGRGWPVATRCLIGALAVGVVDLVLAGALLARRFFVVALLALALPAWAGEPIDWHGMGRAADHARVETNAVFWREEAGFKLDLIEAEVVISPAYTAEQRAALLRMIADARRTLEREGGQL